MRLLWILPLIVSLAGLAVALQPQRRPVVCIESAVPEPVQETDRTNVPRAIVSMAPEFAPVKPAPIAEPAVEETAAEVPVAEEQEVRTRTPVELLSDPSGMIWSAVIVGDDGDYSYEVEVRCGDRLVFALGDIFSKYGVTVSMEHQLGYHFVRVTTEGGGMGIHGSHESWYRVNSFDDVVDTPKPVFDFVSGYWSSCDMLPFGIEHSAQIVFIEANWPIFDVKHDVTYSPGFEVGPDDELDPSSAAEEWLAENPRPESEGPLQSSFSVSRTLRYVWSEHDLVFKPTDACEVPPPPFDEDDDSFVLGNTDALREWMGTCAWSRCWLALLRTRCEDEKAIALIDEMLR